jgi:hypothetical protein
VWVCDCEILRPGVICLLLRARARALSLPALIYRVCLCVASVSSSVSWPLCLPTTADVHRQPHAFSWLQDFRVDVISETDDMIEFDMIGVDAAVVSFDDRKKSDLYFFVSPCHDPTTSAHVATLCPGLSALSRRQRVQCRARACQFGSGKHGGA